MNLWTRRTLIKTAAAGGAAMTLPSSVFGAAKKAIPIALQLYSVRDICSKDFDQALTSVAKLGFDGVEFAGYYQYGKDAKALRKLLDDLGLKVAATHIGTGTLVGDQLKQTMDFHKILGCKFLIVPGDGAFTDPEKSKALAETFNTVAAALKPEGMFCGYHNHSREFAKVGESTFWDLFAERTTKDVVLQQDVGWSTHAGQDAAALIRKYPGRTKSTHFKPAVIKGDEGKRPIIGEDSVPWEAVIKACREVGGTEWITVEQERYPDGLSSLQASEKSFQGLKTLLGKV